LKFRSTKVDAGDFKHDLLNRLRSTMAVNVLTICYNDCYTTTTYPLRLNTLEDYDLESLASDTEGRIKCEGV